MEKFKARSDNFIEGHKCEKCGKVYKRKSYLSRHRLAKHDHDKLQQLKLENEYLLLKINLLMDQIIFFKKLILIQKHINHTNGIPKIQSNVISNNTNILPLTEFTPNMFT